MCVEFHGLIGWGPEHMTNKAIYTTTGAHKASSADGQLRDQTWSDTLWPHMKHGIVKWSLYEEGAHMHGTIGGHLELE